MTIVFFSNNLNHHQVALCDELYALCGDDFKFVEISALSAARRDMGFSVYDRKYKISAMDHPDKAQNLAREADVAIMGASSYEYLKIRVKNKDKLTFSYSERWLKKGFWNILSPVFLLQIQLYLRYGKRGQWFMLCASGFLSKDLNRLHLFKGRCYKWGYFPGYNHDLSNHRYQSDSIRILWVGRFIGWKRPIYMLDLALHLAQAGYDFSITMIGDGPEKAKIETELENRPGIKSKFHLLGNHANERVIEEMVNSHIFCATSSRQEGWGAVIGEAMAAGCCPVVSSDAGATPFLILDGVNGLVFKSGDMSDLYAKVSYLIDHSEQRRSMAENAKKHIHKHWSATVAARNLVKLCKRKLNGDMDPDFVEEPCELITTKNKL